MEVVGSVQTQSLSVEPVKVETVSKQMPKISSSNVEQISKVDAIKIKDGNMEVDLKDVQTKKAIEQINKSIATESSAVFGIHEDTKRMTIKIVDKETQEVIREMPPEKTLDMIAKVWEMAGILVDEKR